MNTFAHEQKDKWVRLQWVMEGDLGIRPFPGAICYCCRGVCLVGVLNVPIALASGKCGGAGKVWEGKNE